MPLNALIGMTPQRDPNNFPQWAPDAAPGSSGHPYPKMLTRRCTEEDREEWLVKNRRWDNATREHYYDAVAPKVGSPIPYVTDSAMVNEGLAKAVGEEIVVADAEQEHQMRLRLGLIEPAPIPLALEE